MTLVIRIKIVTVNNAYRIIQLQTVLETLPASRVEFQHPTVFHLSVNSCGNSDGLPGFSTKTAD